MSRYSPSGKCCNVPCNWYTWDPVEHPLKVIAGEFGGRIFSGITRYGFSESGVALAPGYTNAAKWISWHVRSDTVGQVAKVLLFSDIEGNAQVEVRLTFGDASTCGTFQLFDGAGSPLTTSPASAHWAQIEEWLNVFVMFDESRILAGLFQTTESFGALTPYGRHLSVSSALSLPDDLNHRVGIGATIDGGYVDVANFVVDRWEATAGTCHHPEPCNDTPLIDSPGTEQEWSNIIAQWRDDFIDEIPDDLPATCDATVTAGGGGAVDVRHHSAVLSAWDRDHGYTSKLTFATTNTLYPYEGARLIVDGGGHHATLDVDSNYTRLRVYRGASLLVEHETAFDLLVGELSLSLWEDRICATLISGNSIYSSVSAVTTPTHNGDWIQAISPGGISELLTTRCSICRGCFQCDGHSETYQVVLPPINWNHPTEGPKTCGGGTYVVEYSPAGFGADLCTWIYDDAVGGVSSNHVRFTIGEYLEVEWTICGGQVINHNGNGSIKFRGPKLTYPTDCEALSGEPLTRIDNEADIAEVTAL